MNKSFKFYIMPTSNAEITHPLSRKHPGEWAQRDLDQKQEILKALYDNIDKLSPEDKANNVGFLASCLREEHTKESQEKKEKEVNELFDETASFEDFRDFFQALKPLDAKLIPFNCKMIKMVVNPWPTSNATQRLPENGSILLEEYLQDSAIPAAVSVSDAHRTIHIAASEVDKKPNVYPIHSVAKVFTGVLAIRMLHEKPDGKHSILSEASMDKPIKELLSTEAWDLLAKGGEVPSPLQTHLEVNHVTLRQLMTHQSGLGDYGYDSGTGTYRDTLERGEAAWAVRAPVVREIRDFLQFSEDKTYPVGEFHYSNLGITLAGLAVENAYKTYQDTHPELSLRPLNFFGMLEHYILKPAKMKNFFERAPVGDEHTVQTNPADKAALGWVGGPAGGYWTTTDDLVKFGQWLYEKCTDPKDRTFKDLIERHGEEFYDKDKGLIVHPGSTWYSTAFFSLDLKTGRTVAIASTEGSAASLGLEIALGNQVFTNATQQFKDRLRYMAPTESSEAKKREKFSPNPLDMTAKPPWKL